MMKSPYPLEHELGLSWYRTDTPGIQGRLRNEPEDFIVEEIAEHPISSGPYLICRLTKRNWDQQRAIREIANRLAISHQRIGFAGTKDKRAVTTQYISIHKISSEQVTDLRIKDMQVTPLGYSEHQLSLGDLTGNAFTITITEPHPDTPDSVIDSLLPEIETGIPNYFGYQRFGVARPVTHLVGLQLLKGDYEEAVRTFVSMEGTGENDLTTEGRRYYAETNDPKGALHLLPIQLSLERTLLHYLTEHPGDYGGAIQSFPRTLRSMFVSAVQSWFFNRTVSMRIDEGRGLSEPGIGDRLVFSDGKTDQVSQSMLRLAMMQIKRGRCQLAIHMQGSENISREGPDDRNMRYVMEESGISSRMFDNVSEFLGTRFNGALRPVVLTTGIRRIPGNNITIGFSLDPGQYATTVLREIMKAEPEKMV